PTYARTLLAEFYTLSLHDALPISSQYRLTMRSTERTRKPSTRELYSAMITKLFCRSVSGRRPVARAMSRIGMVPPRMLATPHTTLLDLGMLLSRGQGRISLTLNTLMP